jgi:glutathione S-transferase
MHLMINTTSPYTRIARIALAEKGHGDVSTDLVDPWGDTSRLLQANSAGRVPTLIADDGRPLTESLLILLWLEHRWPQPSLLVRPGAADATGAISRAGIAMGVIDAAVHTLIGRKITDAGFDGSPVGLRRRRSMVEGLKRLEADAPVHVDGTPLVDAITAVVALDYIDFRFPQADWLPALPHLRALAAQLAARPSFQASRPT